MVLLMLATGVVLAPGAVVGMLAAIARPRARAEAAFGIVVALFAAALLLETALYASNGSPRFQERYLMALSPLLVPAFALGLRRSGGWKYLGGAVAAGLLLFTARVPLSGYTLGTGKQDSPFLAGVYQLQQWTTSSAGVAIVAFAAPCSALLGAAALVLPRRGAAVAVVIVCAIAAGLSFASMTFDHAASSRARVTYTPGDRQWVDHAHVGATDILLLADTPRAITPIQLFWNTSLRDVMLLPHADMPDTFRQFPVRIAPDGTVIKNGHPTQRPLLLEEYLGKASLQNAERVRTTLMSTLWRPTGNARFSWLERGRYFDGWLASKSSITIWPDSSGRVAGTLKLKLYLRAGVEAGSVRLSGPGFERTVRVQSGAAELGRHSRPRELGLDAQAPVDDAALPPGRTGHLGRQLPADLRAHICAQGSPAAADRG